MSSLVLPSPQHAPTTSRTPPLVHALALILGDLVSTLVFSAVFALTHGLGLSFAIAVATGIGGVLWTRWRGRRVDAIQWLSLGLVVVFGAAALVAHDPRFVMLKPTLIYLAVAATMLKRGWMTRYMPPIVLKHGPEIADRFGYVWSAGMFALAVANLALAAHGDMKLWASFLAAAPLGIKLVLVATQYGVTRWMVRRRVIAAMTRTAV